MCQIADNDDYLSRSPCNCDMPMRIHLRCYVHVLDSICTACGCQMKPVVINGKGRIVEFTNPKDSNYYLQYFVNRDLYIHGTLSMYEEGTRMAKYTYRNNILDGQSVIYDKNGDIKKIQYYQGGKLAGRS
jgi:hypothetical protein